MMQAIGERDAKGAGSISRMGRSECAVSLDHPPFTGIFPSQ